MRAFVAVGLPAAVRAGVIETLGALRDADVVRWVDPDMLHITLQFLGRVEEAVVDAVTGAVGAAAATVRPFDLRMKGFGVFPAPGRARVLWAGIEPAIPLSALHAALGDRLGPLGFPPEARDFHPHVTVGRAAARSRGTDVAPIARAMLQRTWDATVPVHSIELMESRLQRGGARYSVVCSFPLAEAT